MVFSSITFLFLFLPLFLVLYFAVSVPVSNRPASQTVRARNLVLLIASMGFYAWGEKLFLLVMLYSTLLDYFVGLILVDRIGKSWSKPIALLEPGGSRTAVQKTALGLSIVGNLTVLAIFKYFNFFVGSISSVLATIGLDGPVANEAIKLALPIGISFYTFQSMSYTIDVYRGEVKATRNLIDFACFVTMFPQLVAGPIVRYRDICDQLERRSSQSSDFVDGIRRFILGLGKKVLIANVAAAPADRIFALPDQQITFVLAWIGVAAYTAQIYFDFSGYSDMAIGLGKMLGFRFPENFNYPYVAQSVQDFWRRWHISLSTWFRDYLYISLGGSRFGAARTYLNLVAVFFLCGLWHGASWTFVVWGLYHGAFLVLERVGLRRLVKTLPRPIRHLYVLIVVMVGWVVFRAETFTQARVFLGAMFGLADVSQVSYAVGELIGPQELVVAFAAVIASMPLLPWATLILSRRLAQTATLHQTVIRFGISFSRVVVLAAIFLSAVSWLAAGTYNPFIYFRF